MLKLIKKNNNKTKLKFRSCLTTIIKLLISNLK